MLTNQLYNWQRFWLPREGHIRLDDLGYLADPEGLLGTAVNPQLIRSEAFADIPCLVLLGEPGMGKSTVLQAHAEEVKATVEASGDSYLFCNLGIFQTDALLEQRLFHNRKYLDWLDGSQNLYLYLDSLDECRLNIKTVAALLAEHLKECPVERLHLRITCRTAEWAPGLEQTLHNLWPDGVGVFDLAPLRRVDVATAASSNGINAHDFVGEVERVGAVPLAIKPITLNFLIRAYKSHGHLPTRQADLYTQGCLLLCEEHNLRRRDAGFTGAFTAEERLRAAEQIAFLTLFSNKPVIRSGSAIGVNVSETLSIAELAGVSGHALVSNYALIRESLTTGLFAARSSDELIWSHQTYAEFLAAQFVKRQDLKLAQLMSLLVHPDDSAHRLVPQLHETAAWLAGVRQDVFRAIMEYDPEVLLRSDVAQADPMDRAALVAALLELFDQEQLVDNDRHLNRRYRRLAHPQIAEQLRPYILGSDKGFLVRRVAIDIAEACEERVLQNDLVAVALDPKEPHEVRVQAAWALVRIGDDATQARLKPLALGIAGDDANDDLRGCGLLATWPKYLTAEELFTCLKTPRRENYYGSYKSFLISHCTHHLVPSQLAVALQWAVQHATSPALRTLNSIVDEIMELAWSHLHEPGVLENFAAVALARMEQHKPLFRGDDVGWRRNDPELDALYQDWHRDATKRRRLCKVLLPQLVNTGKESLLSVYSHPPIILPTDFVWLIEQLQHASDAKLREALAIIAARVLRIDNASDMSIAYGVFQTNNEFAMRVRHIFGFVRFDSEEAVQLRAQHYKWRELDRREERAQLKTPPPDELFKLLDTFEAGEVDAWWRLNLFLCYDPTGTEHHGELQSDIRELPGWKAANQETRIRIINAAKTYLRLVQDAPDKWRLDDGVSLYRPSFAGYRALLLLLNEDRDSFIALPDNVWCAWAPIVVGYPLIGGNEREGPHIALTSIGYLRCPTAILSALQYEIEKENSRGQFPSLWRFEHCWDEQLSTFLFDWLKASEVRPATLERLLGEIMEHGPAPEAVMFAEQLIAQPIPDDGEVRKRMLAVGRLLMLHAFGTRWSFLFDILASNPRFGRELVLSVAYNHDRMAGRISSQLSEDQLADFYLWLVQQFPHSEDPRDEEEDSFEFHAVTPREDIARWRDNLLQALKHRGTSGAIGALQRIQAALPHITWLRWIILEAQAITRRQTWVPYSPEDLLALAKDSELRLIDSGEQLLDIIIESLHRLEQYLQGETPAAVDLWNESFDKPTTYRPRDENRLSDYIKQHLVRDLHERGIVINREVEVQRGGGRAPGERTDIKVDAIRKGPNSELYDVITVIIEVKGCWHREVEEAMHTQLRDRYLREYRCQFGLYLVGWFNCTAWDDKDYRKGDAPKLSALEASKQFSRQAALLSRDQSVLRAFVLNTALPDVAVAPVPDAQELSKVGAKKPRTTKKARKSGSGNATH